MTEMSDNPHASNAWEDFRGEGFADVKAAAEYCGDQAQVYDSWADELDDQLSAHQAAGKALFYERRLAGLELPTPRWHGRTSRPARRPSRS